MLYLTVNNTKNFMSLILKNSTFDSFEVRLINIQTFVSFEINCRLDKDYCEEESSLLHEFSLWSELKPYIFQIIKGTKPPKSFKIILSLDSNKKEAVFQNASALFFNILFDGKNIICSTGVSQKNFSLDKTLEYSWDNYISNFLSENNIIVSTLD